MMTGVAKNQKGYHQKDGFMPKQVNILIADIWEHNLKYCFYLFILSGC